MARTSDTHKVCKRCKKRKPVSHFPRHTGSGSRYPNCTECHPHVTKEYRASRGTDYYRNRKLLYNYGITLEEYQTMLHKQGGVCKICKKKPSGVVGARDRYLQVDHCHKTNTVRGLLCFPCNLGLGYFYDNPHLLRQALRYLGP